YLRVRLADEGRQDREQGGVHGWLSFDDGNDGVILRLQTVPSAAMTSRTGGSADGTPQPPLPRQGRWSRQKAGRSGLECGDYFAAFVPPVCPFARPAAPPAFRRAGVRKVAAQAPEQHRHQHGRPSPSPPALPPRPPPAPPRAPAAASPPPTPGG